MWRPPDPLSRYLDVLLMSRDGPSPSPDPIARNPKDTGGPNAAAQGADWRAGAQARIERIRARYGERLARRLLTPAERQDYAAAPAPERLLARRFAAVAVSTTMTEPE